MSQARFLGGIQPVLIGGFGVPWPVPWRQQWGHRGGGSDLDLTSAVRPLPGPPAAHVLLCKFQNTGWPLRELCTQLADAFSENRFIAVYLNERVPLKVGRVLNVSAS